MPEGYSQISLPLVVLEAIDEAIKKHPELGYSSRADFIKDAIRRRIEIMQKEERVYSKD